LTANLAETLWPTPVAHGLSNGTGGCGHINDLFNQGRITEEERLSMRSGSGGKLSADWVERLMGYPDGWTLLEVDVEGTNRYPEWWLSGEWDTIPRICYFQMERQTRIMALGNSIVPQMAVYLWKLIKDATQGVCGRI
jgi:hypothetical protein